MLPLLLIVCTLTLSCWGQDPGSRAFTEVRLFSNFACDESNLSSIFRGIFSADDAAVTGDNANYIVSLGGPMRLYDANVSECNSFLQEEVANSTVPRYYSIQSGDLNTVGVESFTAFGNALNGFITMSQGDSTTFGNCGDYSVVVSGAGTSMHRLIVLSSLRNRTVACSVVFYLTLQLTQARIANQRVLIIGSDPPIINPDCTGDNDEDCTYSGQSMVTKLAYAALMREYADIITLQVFGGPGRFLMATPEAIGVPMILLPSSLLETSRAYLTFTLRQDDGSLTFSYTNFAENNDTQVINLPLLLGFGTSTAPDFSMLSDVAQRLFDNVNFPSGNGARTQNDIWYQLENNGMTCEPDVCSGVFTEAQRRNRACAMTQILYTEWSACIRAASITNITGPNLTSAVTLIRVTMTIDSADANFSFADFVPGGEMAEAAADALRSDLATHFGLAENQIEFVEIREGSLIVVYNVLISQASFENATTADIEALINTYTRFAMNLASTSLPRLQQVVDTNLTVAVDRVEVVPESSFRGLSGGAIAGIVVGSVVGAILLIVIVFGAIVLSRKSSTKESEGHQEWPREETQSTSRRDSSSRSHGHSSKVRSERSRSGSKSKRHH